MTNALTRMQIIDLAKRLVLSDGPDMVLEFGCERMDNIGWPDKYGKDNCEAILEEACRQADRVYKFLGYERLY